MIGRRLNRDNTGYSAGQLTHSEKRPEASVTADRCTIRHAKWCRAENAKWGRNSGASARKHSRLTSTIDLAPTSRELTPQKFPFPPKPPHSPEGKKADGRTLTKYSENKLIKFGALFTFPSRTKSHSFAVVPAFYYRHLLVIVWNRWNGREIEPGKALPKTEFAMEHQAT